MAHRSAKFALALGALLALPGARSEAQTLRSVSLARQYRAEQLLKVKVEFAAGSLHVAPGPAGSLYRMELRYDQDRFTPLSQFDPARDELVIGVRPTGPGGLRVSNREHLAQEAVLQLSPTANLILDASLGATEGNLDLGGLKLVEGRIEAGASRTVLRFSSANPLACRRLELAAGAAAFEAHQLGNSHCREIRFEGGVGGVTLDLTGDWREDASVALSVTMGELNLILPRDAGIQLDVARFLATFEPKGFTRQGSVYRSENFDSAARRLRIHLSSTIGEVNVEWR